MNHIAPIIAIKPLRARLSIDPARTVAAIVESLRHQVHRDLRRRGLVLGLSGGVDSSVCAALAVAALGADKVFALLMPERESDPDSLESGRLVADTFGIRYEMEDITAALEAMGCYRRRDDVIRSLEPAYGPGWGSKLTIADALTSEVWGVSKLVLQDPTGRKVQHRMTAPAYLGIVAAANMKQRTRKQIEYYHADRLNYAVLGTPNRLEYDQGFFVKNGDGAADVKPIAHLYKSQVYQLAEWLGVPKQITDKPPTTDTWPLPQTQEEFYFSVSYDKMDLCLFALNTGAAAAEVARESDLSLDQVEHVWRTILAKRRATRALHLPPLLVEPIRCGPVEAQV